MREGEGCEVVRGVGGVRVYYIKFSKSNDLCTLYLVVLHDGVSSLSHPPGPG